MVTRNLRRSTTQVRNRGTAVRDLSDTLKLALEAPLDAPLNLRSC